MQLPLPSAFTFIFLLLLIVYTVITIWAINFSFSFRFSPLFSFTSLKFRCSLFWNSFSFFQKLKKFSAFASMLLPRLWSDWIHIECVILFRMHSKNKAIGFHHLCKLVFAAHNYAICSTTTFHESMRWWYSLQIKFIFDEITSIFHHQFIGNLSINNFNSIMEYWVNHLNFFCSSIKKFIRDWNAKN